jgi:16S rRNA (adenine1518-N6/adenine1519-N6)-dimethyltransferase
MNEHARPSEILATLQRRPRKRLGQHFLADTGVARRIVDLAQLTDTERVVEIGPGLGALSALLVERARELWLIEVDADFAARLRTEYAQSPHVHVVEADALRIDFRAMLGVGDPAVVVANLPYNVATAILAVLLDHPDCFSRLVLMLQREVVERLRAAPGTKDYGALSVFTQFEARLRPGLRVAPGAFVPRPKVESEVLVLEPYTTPPVDIADSALFKRIVRTAFNQRRKQLQNSLRPVCTEAAALLRSVDIDPTRRPETLTLAEFAALSNALGRTTENRLSDNRETTDNRQQRTDP